MAKETTTDSTGAVISVSTKAPTYTVSFGKKVGKPNYGNEEFSIFAQVEVDPADDLAVVEAKLDAASTFVKAFVYKQLGVMSAVNTDTGVVTAIEAQVVPVVAAAKPAYSKPAGRPAGGGGGRGKRPEPTELWQQWLDDSTQFFDNTAKKASGQYKDNASDYTHKETRESLWIKDMPQWVKDALDEPM